jgi:hypothetical protein
MIRQLELKLARRIENLGRRRYTTVRIAEELRLPVPTKGWWLRRPGLAGLRNLESMPAVVRYERKRRGELLRLDGKEEGRIQGVGSHIRGDWRKGARRPAGSSSTCAWMMPRASPTPRSYLMNAPRLQRLRPTRHRLVRRR